MLVGHLFHQTTIGRSFVYQGRSSSSRPCSLRQQDKSIYAASTRSNMKAAAEKTFTNKRVDVLELECDTDSNISIPANPYPDLDPARNSHSTAWPLYITKPTVCVTVFSQCLQIIMGSLREHANYLCNCF